MTIKPGSGLATYQHLVMSFKRGSTQDGRTDGLTD